MTPAEFVLHFLALWLGVFLALFGLAFWVAGFANPRTNSLAQNVYATTCLATAIPLLFYTFSGSLPY